MDNESIDYSQYGGTVEKADPDYAKYGGTVEKPEDNKNTKFDPLSAMLSTIGAFHPATTGLVKGGLNQIANVAKGAVPLTKQLLTEPGRAAKNVAAIAPRIGHELINAPHNLPEFLSQLGYFPKETAENIAKHIPAQKEIGADINQVLGLEQNNPENEAVQQAGQSAFGLMPGGGTAAEGAAMVAKRPVGFVSNVAKYGQREKAANEAEQAAKMAEENHAAQEHEARASRAGTANESTLERNINANSEELNQVNQKIDSLPKEMHAAPSNPNESLLHLDRAKQAHEEAKGIYSKINNDTENYLGKGKAHDVHLASGIDEKLNARREEIGNEYKDINADLKQKNITLTNPRDAQAVTADIYKLVQENKSLTPEYKSLIKELDEVGKSDVIPADKYLTMIRSLRDYSREARKKAYSHGINAEEREAAMQKFNELDERADQMSSILEEGVGKGQTDKLKSANKAWREEVVPLYRNPIYKAIHYKEQMPKDVIKELRGKEPGNLIIKKVIQEDPNLLKNAVGQRYAENPSKIHKYNELTSEYLNKSPELQKIVDLHKEAKESVKNADETVKMAEKRHKVTEELHNENEKRVSEKKNLEDQKKELKEKLPMLEKTLEELRQSRKRKDISLKEKLRIESEFERSRKAIAAIKTIIGVTSGAYAVKGALKMIGSLMKK